MNAAAPALLFLHRNTHPRHFGGIERKIISIADELHRRGLFRCHLLTNHADSPLAQGVRDVDGRVHTDPMAGAGAVFRTASMAGRICADHGVVLLQSHTFWASLPAGLLRRRRRDLRHLFRIHTHIEGSSISTVKSRLYHGLDRINQGGVDRYCVLSSVLHDELRRHSGIPERKISVLMNGVPEPGKPHAIQDDAHPLPPRIAVVGDLQERKRQDLAVEAVALLRRRGHDVPCQLIGLPRGDYGNRLAVQAERLGVADLVEFRGFLDPVTPHLEGTEVMVLQSDFEGIPTCMVEAMALNMVAVASDVGGTADLIRDGENGFLLPPGDAGALADVLERIFTTPSRELVALRRAGRTAFDERCSLDAMMAGLVHLYRELGVLPPEVAT